MGRLRDVQERMHANPATRQAWRVGVGLAGLVVVVVGLVLVPFPGPGWLIVFVGVGIWGLEFEWAQRLRRRGEELFRLWVAWVGRQPVWMRALIGLATAAFVGLVVLATMWFTGVPSWLPDAAESTLREHLPAR